MNLQKWQNDQKSLSSEDLFGNLTSCRQCHLRLRNKDIQLICSAKSDIATNDTYQMSITAYSWMDLKRGTSWNNLSRTIKRASHVKRGGMNASNTFTFLLFKHWDIWNNLSRTIKGARTNECIILLSIFFLCNAEDQVVSGTITPSIDCTKLDIVQLCETLMIRLSH